MQAAGDGALQGRVLVVEDDADVREVMADALAADGHEVVVASDGRAALDELAGRPFDLVLLDVALGPGPDGVDVCRRLRAAGDDAHVVAVTARDGEADIVLALEAGADDYVTKPGGIAQLRSRVRAAPRRGRRHPAAADLLRARGPARPDARRRAAAVAPGAARRDLRRSRVPRPARDRRPRAPPAREARRRRRRPRGDRHGARRRLPHGELMRLRRPGLRTRLMLALVATSAVTLVAATFTLVPPLEHRLVDDQVGGMRELARTARLGLERLPASDLRPGAERQRDVVGQLARRMGGRVALFDARGIELADTDPGARSRVPERLVDAGYTRESGDLRQRVADGEAIVVAGMTTRAGPRTLVLAKSLDDSRAAAAVVRRALPVAAAVGIALALALGVALGFGLMRRLERLRRGARRVGPAGIPPPPRPRGARP